jgi:hypothetical protein
MVNPRDAFLNRYRARNSKRVGEFIQKTYNPKAKPIGQEFSLSAT